MTKRLFAWLTYDAECSDVRFQDKLRLIVTPQTMWSKWRHNDTAFHRPQLYLQDDIASVMSFSSLFLLRWPWEYGMGRKNPSLKKAKVLPPQSFTAFVCAWGCCGGGLIFEYSWGACYTLRVWLQFQSAQLIKMHKVLDIDWIILSYHSHNGDIGLRGLCTHYIRTNRAI